MGRDRIFAKYPIPNMKKLKKEMERLSKTLNKSFSETLDLYIRGRIGDIVESTEKIFREKQRIKKAKRCIKIALSLINKGASKKAKFIGKKYYDDILDYEIGTTKDKIKHD